MNRAFDNKLPAAVAEAARQREEALRRERADEHRPTGEEMSHLREHAEHDAASLITEGAGKVRRVSIQIEFKDGSSLRVGADGKKDA